MESTILEKDLKNHQERSTLEKELKEIIVRINKLPTPSRTEFTVVKKVSSHNVFQIMMEHSREKSRAEKLEKTLKQNREARLSNYQRFLIRFPNLYFKNR